MPQDAGAIDAPWTEARNGGKGRRELWELGNAAALALAKEDAELRVALGAGKAADYTREGAAPGLTYALYETTLVYVIFKTWAPWWHVQWDCVRAVKDATQPGLGGPIDLVVRSHGGSDMGFEVKWWASERVGLKMLGDAGKLQRWINAAPAGAPARVGHLIALWWTNAERLEDDHKSADEWQKANAPLLYRASFPTAGPGGQLDRRFFIDVMEGPSAPSRST